MQENICYEDASEESPTDGIDGDSTKYVNESFLQKIQALEPVMENANQVVF